VTITGTEGNDVITRAVETYTGPLAVVVPPWLRVTINGRTTRYASPLVRISVLGGGGNDSIRVLNDLGPLAGGATGAPTVTLDGGAGRDTLRAPSRVTSGGYTLLGGDGSDLLVGTDQGDALDGGAGRDRLLGRAGDDTLLGGEGNDILQGGAGNDALTGGAGADRIFGGAGDDTAADDAPGDVLRLVEHRQTTPRNVRPARARTR
jgi:Ca2+-binding RTX toxin-like protein